MSETAAHDDADPGRRRSATRGCATTASAARSRARSAQRELPAGVHVMDFGTGGLDLAYEVMRGYDALMLSTSAVRAARPARCT